MQSEHKSAMAAPVVTTSPATPNKNFIRFIDFSPLKIKPPVLVVRRLETIKRFVPRIFIFRVPS